MQSAQLCTHPSLPPSALFNDCPVSLHPLAMSWFPFKICLVICLAKPVSCHSPRLLQTSPPAGFSWLLAALSHPLWGSAVHFSIPSRFNTRQSRAGPENLGTYSLVLFTGSVGCPEIRTPLNLLCTQRTNSDWSFVLFRQNISRGSSPANSRT